MTSNRTSSTPGADSTSPSTSAQPAGTPTATIPTAASGSPSPAPIDGGCPRINGTKYVPHNSTGGSMTIPGAGAAQSFAVLCDTNWPAGEGNGNPGVRDIMSLYLPSLQDCMAACAEYNLGYQAGAGTASSGGFCRSVAILKSGKSKSDTCMLPILLFRSLLIVPTRCFPIYTAGGSCYLKNASTGFNNSFGFPTAYAMAVVVDGV